MQKWQYRSLNVRAESDREREWLNWFKEVMQKDKIPSDAFLKRLSSKGWELVVLRATEPSSTSWYAFKRRGSQGGEFVILQATESGWSGWFVSKERLPQDN